MIAAAGVHTEPRLAFSPGEAYDKNLTYRAGRCPVRRYLDGLLEVVGIEELGLERVFSHRLALSEGPEAYRWFDNKLHGCVKAAQANKFYIDYLIIRSQTYHPKMFLVLIDFILP